MTRQRTSLSQTPAILAFDGLRGFDDELVGAGSDAIAWLERLRCSLGVTIDREFGVRCGRPDYRAIIAMQEVKVDRWKLTITEYHIAVIRRTH